MSAQLDDDVAAFLLEQSYVTAAEFGLDGPGPPPLLEWADRPEFRTATADAPARILLSRHGPDWWRIRYQIAHEVFHWLCTPSGVFHWTHELLAVETAVRAMERIGEHAYVQRSVDLLTAEAERLPVSGMLRARLEEGYPDGLYGRTFVTGRLLIEAIGWARLKTLAFSFDARGQPDVPGWLGSLPVEAWLAVEGVLGSPAADWV